MGLGDASSVDAMTSITAITLETADPADAQRFYSDTFGLNGQVRLRATDAPTNGFRGFTLSLTTSQPANVKALVDAAVDGGATVVKPVAKSFWGYGGVVQVPDGTIWKIATSAKKDTGPAAKDAGVPADGSGSHRIAIHSDAGTFTDLDGFAFESLAS